MKHFERSRRGFSLVEMAVVGALASLVGGMAYLFAGGAVRNSQTTQASNDASRAILLAAEHIGLDLRRAILQNENDLAIADAGHRISFAMAATEYDERWESTIDVVSYQLETGKGARRLVRTDAKGSRKLHSCVLTDALFQLRPQADSTPWRRTVLVTLTAALGKNDRRVVSVEVPVSRGLPPPAYPFMPPPPNGGSR